MNNDIALSVENLRVVFNIRQGIQKTIVDDVDFILRKGEILGIVGESGSGKTQTVYSILGIHVQNPGLVKGSVNLLLPGADGQEKLKNLYETIIQNTVKIEHDNNKYRYKKNFKYWRRENKKLFNAHTIRGKKIFIMFQDPKSFLNPFWTVRKHFYKILSPQNNSSKIMDKLIKETLNKFKLPADKVADLYPHELSGGMCQRVMIALGYAVKPDIIIADEITTGLDLINQVAVVKHLETIKLEKRQSIILISHDIGFISKLADKILVMYDGQGVEYGNSETILNPQTAKKHPYTKELLDIYYQTHKDGYILGEPPRRNDIVEGCRFHKRCKRFNEGMNCSKVAPSDFHRLDIMEHQIRCKLFQNN